MVAITVSTYLDPSPTDFRPNLWFYISFYKIRAFRTPGTNRIVRVVKIYEGKRYVRRLNR